MQKIYFAEERRIALEFANGSRIEFRREYVAQPDEQAQQYCLDYEDSARQSSKAFTSLPSIEEIQNFLREMDVELPDRDAMAMRLRLTL